MYDIANMLIIETMFFLFLTYFLITLAREMSYIGNYMYATEMLTIRLITYNKNRWTKNKLLLPLIKIHTFDLDIYKVCEYL